MLAVRKFTIISRCDAINCYGLCKKMVTLFVATMQIWGRIGHFFRKEFSSVSEQFGQVFPSQFEPWEWQELVKISRRFVTNRACRIRWRWCRVLVSKRKMMATYEVNLQTKGWDLPWSIPDGNPCHSPSGNIIITEEHIATTAGICGHTMAKNIGNNPTVG